MKITACQDPTSYSKLVFHFYFISFFLLFLASNFSCLVISWQGATVFFLKKIVITIFLFSYVMFACMIKLINT